MPRTPTAARAIAELEAAHETLGSSMQRDIAAGRPPELDAIPGSVLRAAARHGIACPTIERLVGMIAARAGIEPPLRRRLRLRRRPTARRGARRLRGVIIGSDWVAIASTACSSASVRLLVVLAVAEHPEVARHAAVGMDRDPRQDLLALVEAETLQVEMRQADSVGGVGRVLAVMRRHRLREALEVLRDLARVAHRSARQISVCGRPAQPSLGIGLPDTPTDHGAAMPQPRLMIVIASTRPGRVGLPVAEWFDGYARAHGGFEVELVDLLELGLPFMDEPNHPRLRQYTKAHTKAWSARVEPPTPSPS